MLKPRPKLISAEGARKAGKLCACGCGLMLSAPLLLCVVHFPADGTPAYSAATPKCQVKIASALKIKGQGYLFL